MFPHVVQPLRVFEPRYIEMFEAALADDHLISMAVLENGWESEHAMDPPICPVCCLGRIISHDKQPDGTYNFLLAGLQRVRVVQEHETEFAFRSADVELAEDVYQSIPPELDRSLQEEILVAFRSLTPDKGVAHESLEKLMKRHLSLGALADIVAYSAPLQVEQKLRLLSEFDVHRRADTLIESLKQSLAEPTAKIFPPQFSNN